MLLIFILEKDQFFLLEREEKSVAQFLRFEIVLIINIQKFKGFYWRNTESDKHF